MLSRLLTLNSSKKQNNPEEVERQFEITRTNYLRDMNKVRRKYESKFMKLAATYGTCI